MSYLGYVLTITFLSIGICLLAVAIRRFRDEVQRLNTRITSLEAKVKCPDHFRGVLSD